MDRLKADFTFTKLNKFYGKSSMLKDISRNKLQAQVNSSCFSLLIWKGKNKYEIKSSLHTRH